MNKVGALKLFIPNRKKYGYTIAFFLFFAVFSVNGKGTGDNLAPSTWAVGLNISTFGPGIGVSKSLNQKMVLCLGYNFFKYNYPLYKLDDELQGDAVFKTGGPLVSLEYKIINKFFLSGGLRYNLTNARLDGQMAESVFIGDIEMYPDEVGLVNVALDPEIRLVPYLGLGYGRGVPIDKKLSLIFEAGAFYHGHPQVDLETTGMLEPTSSEEQESLIENNISGLKFWPVVSIRVMYKLNGN